MQHPYRGTLQSLCSVITPKPCEDAERRIDRPRLQAMSHILQARGNIDLLRAMPSALAAMDAITYQLGRSGSHGARGEILRQPRPAAISKTGIIGGKTSGDIDPLWAYSSCNPYRARG